MDMGWWKSTVNSLLSHLPNWYIAISSLSAMVSGLNGYDSGINCVFLTEALFHRPWKLYTYFPLDSDHLGLFITYNNRSIVIEDLTRTGILESITVWIAGIPLIMANFVHINVGGSYVPNTFHLLATKIDSHQR